MGRKKAGPPRTAELTTSGPFDGTQGRPEQSRMGGADARVRRVLQVLNGNGPLGDVQTGRSAAAGPAEDAEVLDAYSRAVISVMDAMGPAVVGINTAIIPQAQGIGFAIPSSTAKWVVSQILVHGRVRRGSLGIGGRQRPLDRRWVRFHNLNHDQAVEVLAVDPRGPAQRAGVQTGDLIVAIEGRDVASVDDLHRFLAEWEIGQPAALVVVRGRERVTVNIVPTEAGSSP